MVLSDSEILSRVCRPESDPTHMRIEPFFPELQRPKGRPSYGLSCAGYDITLANEVRIFPGEKVVHADTDIVVIPSHGFALGHTVEYIRMPEDVLAQVFTKSTWARQGICLNCTPLEPGWEGQITIEIANLSPCPVMIPIKAGIGQIIFYQCQGKVRVPYNKRENPTYQGQKGVVEARFQ